VVALGVVHLVGDADLLCCCNYPGSFGSLGWRCGEILFIHLTLHSLPSFHSTRKKLGKYGIYKPRSGKSKYRAIVKYKELSSPYQSSVLTHPIRVVLKLRISIR
jgi:hypothetical protein